MIWGRVAIGAAATIVAALPAHAQSEALASLEVAARQLKPGQYLWRDLAPGNGAVAVIVSIPLQVAFVYRDAELIGVASVSTGKRGKPTPLGDYTILQKRVFHRSNLYSNAPMPYMQRLTWSGIAMHGGHNPGYPASHGCIRLPQDFAVLLYGATALGGAVAVVDEAMTAPPAPGAVPQIIAEATALGGGRFAQVTWTIEPDDERRPSLNVADDRQPPDARLIAPRRRG